MKKLLLSAFAVCCICAAPAQEKPVAFQSHQAVFTNVSTNGNWAAGSTQGVGYLLNAQTGELSTYYGDNVTYDIYCVSNTGIAVGAYKIEEENTKRTPCYITDDGDVVDLPNSNSGVCMACSNDGSILVGNIDGPVVWYRNASGGYDMCESLPFEKMGFDKRPYQSTWVMGISCDGLRIYGRAVDASGIIYWPVFWERSSISSKDWVYRRMCADYCFNKDETSPEWPQYTPTEPDIADYLSEDELAAFNHAIELYNDSVEKAGWWLPEEEKGPYPTYNPNEHVDDFFDVTTPDGIERHNRYAEDYNKFREEGIVYNDSVKLYFDRYSKYVNIDKCLQILNMSVSENGKYIATITANDVVMINPVTEEITIVDGAYGSYPTTVLDDGTVFIGQSAVAFPLDRIPSVYKDGKVITFDEWLKGRSRKAYDDLIAAFPDGHFGVIYSRDPKGKTFGGFNQSPIDYTYTGWVMNLDAYDDFTAGISEAEISGGEIKVSYNRDCGSIDIAGTANADVRIFSINGSCVLKASSVSGSVSVSSLADGAYIVEVKAEGKVLRKKVILQ